MTLRSSPLPSPAWLLRDPVRRGSLVLVLILMMLASLTESVSLVLLVPLLLVFVNRSRLALRVDGSRVAMCYATKSQIQVEIWSSGFLTIACLGIVAPSIA